MWKTKITHILELYDGYTGQPADAGQFRIASSIQKMAWMAKDNGRIVFCDCEGTEAKVSLESRWYMKKQIYLKKAGQEEKIQTQRVWVFPGPAYPQEEWEILGPGEAPPLCRAEFFPVMEKADFRLLEDIGIQDTYLYIFHRKHESLEGREILLYPGELRLVLGRERELFCFELEHPVDTGEKIKKSEAGVTAGYEGFTQADGSFRIAVPGKKSSMEKGFLYIQGQKHEIIHSYGKEV